MPKKCRKKNLFADLKFESSFDSIASKSVRSFGFMEFFWKTDSFAKYSLVGDWPEIISFWLIAFDVSFAVFELIGATPGVLKLFVPKLFEGEKKFPFAMFIGGEVERTAEDILPNCGYESKEIWFLGERACSKICSLVYVFFLALKCFFLRKWRKISKRKIFFFLFGAWNLRNSINFFWSLITLDFVIRNWEN